jgi:hypothetical protein
VFGYLGSKVELTNEITSKLENIVLGEKNQIIEDSFDELLLGGLDLSKISHKQKPITFSQTDKIALIESNQNFISNYHFNILLIMVLGLEMLIKLLYNFILKNLESNSLKSILFLCIVNYTHIVWYYNEKFTDLKGLDIPKDFPKSFDPADSNICYCDINKTINSFTLVISGLSIDPKYYISTEINEFCKNKCLNTNSAKSSNLSENLNKNILKTDLNRKYSTLRSRNNILIRKFSTSRNTKPDSNISLKDINYNRSVFLILEKIKELTEGKIYNPTEVQLKIENF